MKFLKQQLAVAVVTASMAGMACAQSDQESSDLLGSSAGQSEAAIASFNDLDKDQNGVINAVEATGDSTLMEKWTTTDANADRKIDRSEFSKLETKEAQPGAAAPADAGMSQDTQESVEQPQQDGARSQY